MDIDSDTGDDNHSRDGFRPGAGRQRKAATTSIQIMANKRREESPSRQEISRHRAKSTEWIDEIK